MQTWRFRSYETPRARSNEHTNKETGTSNLAPHALVPYVAPPPTNPFGGSSETTAGAGLNQTTIEGAVPVSKFYCSHVPRATEWLFGVRRPYVPEAQDRHETGGFDASEIFAGCVPEHKDGRASENSRLKKRLFAVSTDLVL